MRAELWAGLIKGAAGNDEICPSGVYFTLELRLAAEIFSCKSAKLVRVWHYQHYVVKALLREDAGSVYIFIFNILAIWIRFVRVKICFMDFTFSVNLESIGKINSRNLFRVNLSCGALKTVVLSKVTVFLLAVFNGSAIGSISTGRVVVLNYRNQLVVIKITFC